jgi:ketosteroid isomerase-like protein
MGRIGVLGGIAVAAALAGCQPKAETPEQADARMAAETAAARTAIDAANAQYMAHFAASHGDSLAALFAENGRMMVPNAPAAAGRQAIAQGLGMMAGMSPQLTLSTESVVANGPLAVELGSYKFSMSPPGAKEPVTEKGKYLVHWQKVGEKWLMAAQIWNSDDPAMPMPASPPAGKKKP